MRWAVTASLVVSAAFAADSQSLVQTYCVSCHNQKLATAGVALDKLDPAHVNQGAVTWERVLQKLRRGEMPPPGLPRPDESTLAKFTATLEESLDRAAAADPNPGRPAVHRLNRAEYSNAIRDLLAVDIQAGSMLPVDDSGYGFDNIADVLSMSPALLERYLSAAKLVSRLAVGDLQMKPTEERFAPLKDPPSQVAAVTAYRRSITRLDRVSPDLPFDSRGGLSFQYYFPLDAEYLIRIALPTGAASYGEGITGDVNRTELRLSVKAGLHTVGVAFMKESAKPEVEGGGRGPRSTAGRPMELENDPVPAKMDLRLDGARLKLFDVPRRPGTNPDVNTVIITGPYNITGRGETPSRAKIFVCRPKPASEEEPCARQILRTLAHRAFRRPVSDTDLKPLLAFYQHARSTSDFDRGIQAAIQAMLVSPDFLFRAEQEPRGVSGKTYRMGSHDLASRLSFFLWSSIPDDELLALADQDKLQDPEIRRQQVRRMLADPKSHALVSNFAGQWLQLRNLSTLRPDPEIIPEFDESLRRSMLQQSELFFESILREDRSVLDLLTADYTFLNERLALHYGIPYIYGPHFRRVTVTDPNRTGLLGQASILAVTSYPNRTSVVQRGKWILDNLLGAPPPPPPPAGVPELKPHSNDGKPLTMRQQMEQHRADPACIGCHSKMDPIGFALENYDAIGRWRAKDAIASIDATGVLPDGTRFEGPAGLTKLMATKYREAFAGAVAEKLMTYALGRGLESYDRPALRVVLRQSAPNNYRMSDMIAAIVESVPFQMRRTSEP